MDHVGTDDILTPPPKIEVKYKHIDTLGEEKEDILPFKQMGCAQLRRLRED